MCFLDDGFDIPRVEELLGRKDVSTTVIYTHVLNRGGQGVFSPADRLWCRFNGRGCWRLDDERTAYSWGQVMSKKTRKVKRRDPQSRARCMPCLERDELYAFVPGSAPSAEMLDDMTRRYQQKIRESPLWDEMVREFGAEEAERILRKFRVEIR